MGLLENCQATCRPEAEIDQIQLASRKYLHRPRKARSASMLSRRTHSKTSSLKMMIGVIRRSPNWTSHARGASSLRSQDSFHFKCGAEGRRYDHPREIVIRESRFLSKIEEGRLEVLVASSGLPTDLKFGRNQCGLLNF